MSKEGEAPVAMPIPAFGDLGKLMDGLLEAFSVDEV